MPFGRLDVGRFSSNEPTGNSPDLHDFSCALFIRGLRRVKTIAGGVGGGRLSPIVRWFAAVRGKANDSARLTAEISGLCELQHGDDDDDDRRKFLTLVFNLRRTDALLVLHTLQ